jgi:hypothetical protein
MSNLKKFPLRECKEYKSKSKKNFCLQQKILCARGSERQLDGKTRISSAPGAQNISTEKSQLVNNLFTTADD